MHENPNAITVFQGNTVKRNDDVICSAEAEVVL